MSSFADRFPPGGYRPALDGGAVATPIPKPMRLRWAHLGTAQKRAVAQWLESDCKDGLPLLTALLEPVSAIGGEIALTHLQRELRHGILHLLATTLEPSLDLDMISRVIDEKNTILRPWREERAKQQAQTAEAAPAAAPAAFSIEQSACPPIITGELAAVPPRAAVAVTEGPGTVCLPHAWCEDAVALDRPFRLIGYFDGKALLICGFHTEPDARRALEECSVNRRDLHWVLAGPKPARTVLACIDRRAQANAWSRYPHPIGGDVFLGQVDEDDVYARDGRALDGRDDLLVMRHTTGKLALFTRGDWSAILASTTLDVREWARLADALWKAHKPPLDAATEVPQEVSRPPRWKRHATSDYFLGAIGEVDWYLRTDAMRTDAKGNRVLLEQYGAHKSNILDLGDDDSRNRMTVPACWADRVAQWRPFHPVYAYDSTRRYLGSLAMPLTRGGPDLLVDVYEGVARGHFLRVFGHNASGHIHDWVFASDTNLPEVFVAFLQARGLL